MRIISTKATRGELEQDLPELLERHQEALKDSPTWQFFGGVITCKSGNQYQVAEEA
tara:strand:- start:900 stop:1067 length:168 start_codon:yes stop_codon:yes gene_type:complete